MSFHAWRQAWLLLALLAACRAADELESGEAESEERSKPHVLKVIEAESNLSETVEIRVLQRHGRAPIPPPLYQTPRSDEELMREFDEVTVEWHTSQLISSIMVRLPERQEQLMKTNATFDGYKFFTGPSTECKFQVSDKHALPDEPTQQARNLADEHMIRSCIADNSDTAGTQARRSSALLKLHPEPNMHHEAGWRYFTMLIRNPQKTPARSSMDGTIANTFQVVMNNTDGKTLVAMSFEALDISSVWVCSYTPWFRTSACTAACGGGYRTEVRRKLHAPAKDYDPQLMVNCNEAEIRATPCNTHECDVDCQLSEWTQWPEGECSRSCGNGTQVERRYVVMGPKGKGKICPPWHTTGVRVRTIPCNQFPCEPSCSESKLAEKYRAIAEASPVELPMEEEERDEANKTLPASPANSTKGNATAENATTSLPAADGEEEVGATTASPGATEEEDNQAEGNETNESLLSLGSQAGARVDFGAFETPRLETGLVKSTCSEPCGGGRRMVLIPSDKKVGAGPQNRACSHTFEEDCNLFPCSPLMLQPANAWQFPVVGKWYMVDVSFVIEELSESFTVRAPPDFLLAATGSRSECFLVEHSLPNLESCNIYPGQAAERTGPIMVFNFSNPLEPQNSFTWKRDWFFFRTWVLHPKVCSGGTKNGRCLGQVGERQWVLSIRDSQPEPLWEVVKGSYEIFVNESDAKEAFESNSVRNLSFAEDAEEVTVTTTTPTTPTTTTQPEVEAQSSTDATESEEASVQKAASDAANESLLQQKSRPERAASGSEAKMHKAQQHSAKRSQSAHGHQGHDQERVKAGHPHHHPSRSQRKMTT